MTWFTYAAFCAAGTMVFANIDRVMRRDKEPSRVGILIMIGCFLACIVFGSWGI